jgi:hypothetical protein
VSRLIRIALVMFLAVPATALVGCGSSKPDSPAPDVKAPPPSERGPGGKGGGPVTPPGKK